MATDLAPRADATGVVTTPRAVHRRRGMLLVAAAVFNLWLWATRMWNLLAETGDVSAAFVGVHIVLYVAATVVALVVGAIGVRQWREARAAAGPSA